MHKKWICRCCCFLVILSLLLFPVNAADTITYSWIQVPDITSQSVSSSGSADYVDGNAFLVEVCTVMALNQEYRSIFTEVPYSIHDINLSGSRGLAILFSLEALIRRPGNTAEYCNGEYIGTVTSYYPEFYGAYYARYDTGSTSFNILRNNNSHIIFYDDSRDPLMNAVVNNLSDISLYLYDINNRLMLTTNPALNSILDAVKGSGADTGTLYSKTTLIANSLVGISQSLNTVANNTSITNTNLTNIYNYLTNQLSYIAGTLDDISDDLYSLKNEFRSYASQALADLDSIDTHLDSIEDTMDEMMEHFNGTALEGVSVRGRSGNLWGLIKNGVSAGLNGFGQFFDVIFGALGYYGSNIDSAFDSLTDITSYQSVPYNPEILENPVLPAFDSRSYTSDHIQYTISSDSITITSDGYNSRTDIQLYTSGFPTIREGTYKLSKSGQSGVTIWVTDIYGSVNLANASTSDVTFTINESKTVRVWIRVGANKTVNRTIPIYLKRI